MKPIGLTIGVKTSTKNKIYMGGGNNVENKRITSPPNHFPQCLIRKEKKNKNKIKLETNKQTLMSKKYAKSLKMFRAYLNVKKTNGWMILITVLINSLKYSLNKLAVLNVFSSTKNTDTLY